MKRLGVAALIRKSEHSLQLLMGRRGKDPNRGLYVLPGGGVEDNETLEEALCREVKEETGLELQPCPSRWKYPNVIELSDRIILVVNATIQNNTNNSLKDGDDLYDVRWFDIDDLPVNMSPAIISFLKSRGFILKDG